MANLTPKPIAWPFPSSEVFEQLHREMSGFLVDYAITGKGRKRASAMQIMRSQSSLAAYRGLGSNPEVRIALVKAIEGNLDHLMHPEHDEELFLVTLVPRKFGFWDKTADRFDPEPLRALAARCLRGFDYIAAIEPGLFDHWLPFHRCPDSRWQISWHVHALVRASDFDALKEQVRSCLDKHSGFVPGKPPYHIKRVQPDHLLCQMRYILKLPRKAYSVEMPAEGKSEGRRPNQAGRVHKRDIGRGEQFSLTRELSRFRIDELIFGGGAGAMMTREAFAIARSMLQLHP